MTLKKTIELNGKIYDTITGKLISETVAKKANIVARPSAKAVHHKPDRPRTLMRDIVRPPKLKPRQLLNKRHSENKTELVLPVSTNNDRLKRATTVKQNNLISRFNQTQLRPSLIKKTAVIAVKDAPEDYISHHHLELVTSEPVDPGNVFVSELATKKSHASHAKHKVTRSKHKRVFTLSTATFAVLLLSVFFAYQNSSNVAFRLAASRAGVRASLPGYRPAGYSLNGPTQYAPGQITISFSKNNSNQSYSLTQKSSSWNSEGLLENFVASNSAKYETIKDKGKTIYIYNDSNATWVDGGVWYQIESSAGLKSDQLVNIANSI
jgi:Domain of unknown function (DUF4367)